MIKCEHYFPDVSDPMVVYRALVDVRMDWDKALDKIEELPEFTDEHTVVQYVLNKSVIGTT